MGFEDRFLRAISGQLDSIIALLKKGAAPTTGRAVHLNVVIGPITKQGAVMQIHDNEQYAITVSAVDSKGFPTTDVFTTAVDNPDVISVVDDDQDGRTFTVVAGNPGSAVITISDGTLSVTEAVDVVVGEAVTISVQEGAPEDQPVPDAPVPGV
jgi:hypothetical protein